MKISFLSVTPTHNNDIEEEGLWLTLVRRRGNNSKPCYLPGAAPFSDSVWDLWQSRVTKLSSKETGYFNTCVLSGMHTILYLDFELSRSVVKGRKNRNFKFKNLWTLKSTNRKWHKLALFTREALGSPCIPVNLSGRLLCPVIGYLSTGVVQPLQCLSTVNYPALFICQKYAQRGFHERIYVQLGEFW